MARVYVSSTIADLKKERQAVMDWLEAADHQVVHSYRPNSETVRESSLDDVGTCDLYVLILGHRYGFQPAQDNPQGLSITHLEFRRAGQSGIPRIALVRTAIPDVSLSDVEDPERATLVWAFRAEVAREVRPARFRNLAELIGRLSTGVRAELTKPPEPVRLGKRRLSPGRIFLNYRREDTGWAAGRLFDRLSHRFGKDQVFKDIDSIHLGDDFVDAITSAVGSCDVLLALIGDRWLLITDGDGQRRLDDDNDFVRLEIEAALTRNVRVIPILVEGARMPRAADLPASMAKLVRRQALKLNPDQEFESGVARLLNALDRALEEMHKGQASGDS
jgi:hypothetical protein